MESGAAVLFKLPIVKHFFVQAVGSAIQVWEPETGWERGKVWATMRTLSRIGFCRAVARRVC